ncbi:MAG: thioesterase domain-containing protein, partial [Gammaproteobacteria bacterium]
SLFQAPTVEQLAVLLREKGWSAPDYSALVAIQPAGSRPPFFCVPGGSGSNLFGMRQIARHLGEDQPVYALHSHALTEGVAKTRIEDIAADYVLEISKVQPEGPYYIGGDCIGGFIAYEVAQQLQARGQQVALLALIETAHGAGYQQRASDKRLRLRIHKEKLALLGMKDKGRYLTERVKRKISLSSKRLACQLCLKLGVMPRVLREEYVAGMNSRAQKAYIAQPYSGKLTLFFASQDIDSQYHDRYREVWGKLVPELQSYDIPSDHTAIFRDPDVRILAQQLNTCIETALAHQTRTVRPEDNTDQISLVS